MFDLEFHQVAGAFIAFLTIFFLVRRIALDVESNAPNQYYLHGREDLSYCLQYVHEFQNEWTWEECKRYSQISRQFEAGKIEQISGEDRTFYKQKTGVVFPKMPKKPKAEKRKKKRKESFEWQGTYKNNQNELK